QIVILVDEYDKPILDNVEDVTLAAELRDILKDFYGSFKPLDQYLRFVFLTGVSKFAKTGIFSGMNNLNDITLDAPYSAICGYTQQDLDTVFVQNLKGFDPNAVREWYNGYSWTGEAVYNPFDILLLCNKRIFRPYWFETGTPSFLIKLLEEKPVSLPDLDNLITGEELLGSFRIEDIKLETLLFQTGYLTITHESQVGGRIFYHLGFPNREVKSSISQLMLGILVGTSEQSANQMQLDSVLTSGNTDRLKDIFYSFFASIPHDWYRKNQISTFEGYYASIVYAYFASMGYSVIPEDTTNKGRIDLTVKTKTGIWVFEFKVKGLDKSDISPLVQLQEREYAGKYRSDRRPVYEIGIIFDPKTRNIEGWEVGER
ncbi:MAG: ATP-binding protein, partial [Methanospirillum sp.]|uniref:PD-(D/E)XK nuclease domain-containing protein n=1 Tax=Methanospirillum sp. TaxID=45200 RepID=UPI00236FF54A